MKFDASRTAAMTEELSKLAVKRVEGLESGEAVGSGSYGSVCVVKVRGCLCIAKRLHPILVKAVSKEESDAMLERFRNECLLLSRLRHPNIVRFIGIHIKGKNVEDLATRLI